MMKDTHNQPLDLAAARARLAGLQGQQYWRGLEELAASDEFEELLRREFPRQAAGWMGPISRRSFLKLMGASLALAGLSACGPQPAEKIVPYVEAPEEIVPGKPLFYATALQLGGFARGVLVESHMGRPTKVEGNPRHPASLGATDVFAQASVLTLYDPDRSQAVSNVGRISGWDAFVAALTTQIQEQRAGGGAGLRILTETITSPTLTSQLETLLSEFPSARWHQYESVGQHNVRAGGNLAFGQNVNTVYRFDQADRILALDADFLLSDPGSLRYAREFIDKRRVSSGQNEMNRLYVVESTPTITGAMADHRLRLRASQIESFARAIAQQVGVAEAGGGTVPSEVPAEWLAALARDLQQSRGRSIVLAGDWQPPIVHALAHAMNQALGNVGTTVQYTAPVESSPVDQMQSLRELVGDMAAGRVRTLIILGGNPVFTAPVDLNFRDALRQVPFRVHLSLYDDETSEECHWHIPETHDLEAWSDARAFDGTVSIVQPLIAPLYGGKSAHELLATVLGQPARSSYEIVREYWRGQNLADDQAWRQALHEGLIPDSALPPVQVSVRSGFAQAAPAQAAEGLEINFRPDPSLWDGRYANNGWLQELPRPLTLLTWDNAALISARTAIQRLGLQVADPNNPTAEDLETLSRANGRMIELRYRGQSVRAPIWILPGHPDDSVTVQLGYGRRRAGTIGSGVGFDAYALRTADAPWFGSGLEISSLGEPYPLATTQTHHTMENRHLVRAGTLEQYIQHPDFVAEMEIAPHAEQEAEGEHVVEEPPSLYPEYDYSTGNRWGMAIDLNACIGCNRCMIACQAENNIPIVGKTDVLRSREMHWLRVDRYYEGSLDDPATYFQPVPCMHCEKAPCEPVCPVEATSHSAEGLNEMTYNRCIGTRYCSNNCPYKVRRFNYLQYGLKAGDAPVLQLLSNPDVTVRERGVMEKCTYCVQRINAARIEAKKEGRPIRDGEVKTACQEACPTQAIIFGNINDEQSQVRRLKEQPLNYSLLAELGTQPRTTYLARLRNPNPEIEAAAAQPTEHE
ncbi:MAG TPA: TAT-variant-translocated molybdopterin oxidoreductase [Herpetosiphonaceae bacterium]